MKKLLIVFLLLMFLTIGWLLRGVKLSSPITHTAEQKPTTSTMPVSTSSASKFALPPGWQVMTVDEKIASPAGQARIQQFQQIADGENSRPLDFYGQVIDQNGEPVAGAKVLGRILLILGFDRSGGESHYTETDAQGRFQFIGIHGASLTVTPQKPGYEYNSRLPTNWNTDYKPDSFHPMVFTLWKLQGAEPMVHTRLDSRVPYDGRSATFDLLAGKKNVGGELRVTLTRTPQNLMRGADRFDWSVKIDVAGGGLVEASGLYKNLAPESGYQPAVAFAQTKDNPNWTESLTKTFYVHLAKGQYGRVFVDLTMNSVRSDTGIRIETWLNPSGSRNLELDPAKEIKSDSSNRAF